MRIEIIHEDKDIIVCYKPGGFPVQTGALGRADVISELKNYLSQKNGERDPYLGVIHRLDQPVEGLLVLAKNQKAAGNLSRQMTEGQFTKKYLSVLLGIPEEKEGGLTDYLLKEKTGNKSKVVQKGAGDAKKAELSYRILVVKKELLFMGRNLGKTSLAEITLKTGRHHQIRVQFSHAGFPLAGDCKYGKEDSFMKYPALCAWKLGFLHPCSGKWLEFQITPKNEIFEEFLRESGEELWENR